METGAMGRVRAERGRLASPTCPARQVGALAHAATPSSRPKLPLTAAAIPPLLLHVQMLQVGDQTGLQVDTNTAQGVGAGKGRWGKRRPRDALGW